MKQIIAIVGINIGRLLQRPGLAVVNIVGIATAVAVMISLLAIGQGVVRMAGANVNPALAIVLSSGGGSEYTSTISANQVSIISAMPGIRRDRAGHPIVQPFALVGVELTKKGDRGVTNVPFRGTGPQGWTMTPGLHIIAGRMYRPGLRELLVGKGLQAQFENLNVGDTLTLRGSEWKVVGAFEDGGGISENALLGDAETELSAFDRPVYQSVGVELDSPAGLAAFNRALASDPRLSVEAQYLSDYYRRETKQFATVLNFVGYFIGGVMALGVTFGAIMTMYAAVDSRAREYATLRAIGYAGGSILTAILVESLLVALPGLVLGVLAALLLFGRQRASVEGLSFALAFTPGLSAVAVLMTLAIGLLGGFAPALRAARLPIATALRAT